MKENVGAKDQKYRTAIGALLVGLGALGYSGMIPVASVVPQALTSIILTVAGLILVVTGYFRKCLIYRLLDIDTSEE